MGNQASKNWAKYTWYCDHSPNYASQPLCQMVWSDLWKYNDTKW